MAKQDKQIVHVPEKQLAEMEQAVSAASLSALADRDGFARMFLLARGISELRRLLTAEVMAPVMQLQGSALGFKTDKDKTGGYPMETVRDCIIEARLRGVQAVGNEFNIIGGQCYITREGFTRRVRDWPGVSDLELTLGVPSIAKGGALVGANAAWMLDGRAMSLQATIPVRVNERMGTDAILGKAERKLLARVYKRLGGSAHDSGEMLDDLREVDDEVLAAPKEQTDPTEDLTRLAQSKLGGVPPATEAPGQSAFERIAALDDTRAQLEAINADPELASEFLALLAREFRSTSYDALMGADTSNAKRAVVAGRFFRLQREKARKRGTPEAGA